MDAKLVASEIVSNAVLHSGCTPDDRLEVRARLEGRVFEISVHDPGLADEAPLLRQNPDIGGRGLMIVQRLAESWGVAQPDGRLVWAQLLVQPTEEVEL
jgi:serine/threonine-protein kinase RsbW